MDWWWVLYFVTFVAQVFVCSSFAPSRRPSPQRTRHNHRRHHRRRPLLLAQSDPREAVVAIRKCESVPDVLVLTKEFGSGSNAAALRRLATLSKSRHLSDKDRSLGEEKINVLLEEIERTMNSDSMDVSLYALADILCALSKLRDNKNVIPLANRVLCRLTESEQELVKTLRPYRLVECLEALVALQIDHLALIRRICHRLQQGDALASLEPRYLARGLKAMVAIDRHANDKIAATIKAFMRRWRKQSVRRSASIVEICQALYAARRLQQQLNADDRLVDETTTMVHTLFRELRSPSPETSFSPSLTAGQVAEVLMTASAFHVNATNPIVDFVMETLKHEPTMERATVPDIARILVSMERLSITQYTMVIQCLGLQLRKLVQQETEMEPRSVCNILKSADRLCHRGDEELEPFVGFIRDLIVQSSSGGVSFFLQCCSDMELSSLARFLCIIRCNDEEVMVQLCERILEPDIVASCSPKAASWILAYITTWTDASSTDTKEMRPILSELFHELGAHLLSAQLTSAETSASIHAYARASYVHDMGIFDYLARHLSSLLPDCSIRQVVQALWSCGKMRLWEADYGEEEEVGLPYLEAARDYAAFLASKASQLNSKDVSQALWAIGRLGIKDSNVVKSFARQASRVSPECNSLEVSNILWGLSRVGYDDCEVISVLTGRMLDLEPSPQEAATVLYALGRMGIRDEEVFSAMSEVMMGQLESASAQAIANALWAYRTVEISPPRELMDSWVLEKLGLDGVPNRIQDL